MTAPTTDMITVSLTLTPREEAELRRLAEAGTTDTARRIASQLRRQAQVREHVATRGSSITDSDWFRNF